MSEKPTPDFHLLLREAEEIVREKPVYHRYIDGTPLQNDVPVWMAVFVQSHIHSLEEERDEAREALRKAIAQADFWFDDSTAGGKCPDLDDERALLARIEEGKR